MFNRKGFTAVRDVNFALAANEFLAVVAGMSPIKRMRVVGAHIRGGCNDLSKIEFVPICPNKFG